MLNHKNAPPKNLFSFMGHFLRPYRAVAIVFVCIAICAGFWGPFNSILIKHLINLLPTVQNGDISSLVLPASLIVINFIVFDNFTWRGVGYINYKYQRQIKNHIIRETLDYIYHQSHQFFQDNLSGRISNQITTLADNIEIILHRISLDMIRGTSLLITSFIASFYVNPAFCYTLIIWFIAFASFSIWMSSHLVPLADHYAENESLLSGQVVDGIANNSNVRIFSRKSYELNRLDFFFQKLLNTFKQKERFLLILYTVQGSMIASMMAFAVYFLVHFYSLGLVSIGDFALILGLSMELGHMMWYTMQRVDDFNQSLGKCKQSLSALMILPEILDKHDAKPINNVIGKITFSGVNFHYKSTASTTSPTTPDLLFQNKSIEINAGQKVGLVGYSGAGKSTFVNLILRLYDVTEGAILIDDQNIRDVTQDSLRENIATIPQDPTLFHRSLMDNIRYGRIEASDEDVIQAAKKSHAHDFIVKLPQGYDSLVGERGVKLSGGQRQRIAIARAILKNAPILILDEATSQLDSVTENLIQNTLWELMSGKTTIVIAHRLSTLLHMDRLLVFDKGEIVEDGTHTELLTKDSLYKKLWDAQVGGFIGDTNTEDAL